MQDFWDGTSLHYTSLQVVVSVGSACPHNIANCVNDPRILYASLRIYAGGDIGSHEFINMNDLDMFTIESGISKKLSAVVVVENAANLPTLLSRRAIPSNTKASCTASITSWVGPRIFLSSMTLLIETIG